MFEVIPSWRLLSDTLRATLLNIPIIRHLPSQREAKRRMPATQRRGKRRSLQAVGRARVGREPKRRMGASCCFLYHCNHCSNCIVSLINPNYCFMFVCSFFCRMGARWAGVHWPASENRNSSTCGSSSSSSSSFGLADAGTPILRPISVLRFWILEGLTRAES